MESYQGQHSIIWVRDAICKKKSSSVADIVCNCPKPPAPPSCGQLIEMCIFIKFFFSIKKFNIKRVKRYFRRLQLGWDPLPPTDNICNSTVFLYGWLPLTIRTNTHWDRIPRRRIVCWRFGVWVLWCMGCLVCGLWGV